MTKQECENLILEKLKEIDKIHKEYNPNGKHLSMYIIDDSFVVNNVYWDNDSKYPVDGYWVLNEEEIYDDNQTSE